MTDILPQLRRDVARMERRLTELEQTAASFRVVIAYLEKRERERPATEPLAEAATGEEGT